MLRFTTFFPKCPNFGLMKDVGQIPYYLSKTGYIEAKLVSTELELNSLYVDQVKGLKLENIPLHFRNETITGCLYILKNAKKIDWLNLYHTRRNTLIWILLYKVLNPKGRVYVKLDAGFEYIRDIKESKRNLSVFRRIVKHADLTSAESKIAVEMLSDIAAEDIMWIPNGTTETKNIVDFEKEDIFLTVGRIGAPEKNDELLVESFLKISDKCDWNLVMVGKVTEDFMSFIDEIYDMRPDIKNRIIIVGEVTDKKELFMHYCKAKVFIMPSKYESFNIACCEALINGCYLILSNQVTPKTDFTDNGKYGCEVLVDDVDDLAKKMLDSIEIVKTIDKNEIITFAKDNYLWKDIAEKIFTKIMSFDEKGE